MRMLFTPETQTGTLPSVPSSTSPGEPQCRLMFEVKHPEVPMLRVCAFKFLGGGVELELSQLHSPRSSLVHLSVAMSVDKHQSCELFT